MHLPLLAKRSDLFEIAALCDLSAGTLAALGGRYGIARLHLELDELLAAAGSTR